MFQAVGHANFANKKTRLLLLRGKPEILALTLMTVA